LSTDLFDPRIHDSVELIPLFWRVVMTFSHWQILGEYTVIIVSLPIAEAENRRTFSIRKYIIRECRARSKNISVNAQIRTCI
jgi:hypothetical protein